jgi:hypothetical protein
MQRNHQKGKLFPLPCSSAGEMNLNRVFERLPYPNMETTDLEEALFVAQRDNVLYHSLNNSVRSRLRVARC